MLTSQMKRLFIGPTNSNKSWHLTGFSIHLFLSLLTCCVDFVVWFWLIYHFILFAFNLAFK